MTASKASAAFGGLFVLGCTAVLAADVGNDVQQIEQHIDALDETVWKNERLAEQYEVGFIVELWDRLRAAKDPFAVLAEVPFASVGLGTPLGTRELDVGIRIREFGAPAKVLDRALWKTLVETYRDQGYVIEHTDWHHAEFRPATTGAPSSVVTCRIDVTHPDRGERATLEGELHIRWDKDPSRMEPHHIDASRLRVKYRTTGAAFGKPLVLKADDYRPPIEQKLVFSPVMVYDLNQDGLPEVIAGGMSVIFWNKGGGNLEPAPMAGNNLILLQSGVIGDFTGDGVADLLGVLLTDFSVGLFPGVADKGFTTTANPVCAPGVTLRGPNFITAGDVDGDGDLDAWIGQWMSPYGHSMPEQYFDANDGFPSYLLINQGEGTFVDGTEQAGLAAKRNRRAYSGSFFDLDEDGDLDLLTVNDFAGVDLYHNDGAGRFTDVTGESIDEPHNFGMAHTIADFDLDGQLDLYVQGMSSTTARRLDRLKAGREERPELTRMRTVMGYGNRMYLGQGKGRFAQPSFRDQVARTGWSWGSVSLDFDNDADVDLFVANGNASGKSTRDYCTKFWCHDIYLPKDKPDVAPSLQEFFNTRKVLPEISWDGFQPNRLLVSHQGQAFEEAGHVLGVGQNYDSRSAIGMDIDGDGWQDLLVRYLILGDDADEYLMLMKNQLGQSLARNWIGVRLLDGPGSVGIHGARVQVVSDRGTRIGCIVSGDSFHCQHPMTQHFGLADQTQVDSLEVTWADGITVRIDDPAVNRYHAVAHP